VAGRDKRGQLNQADQDGKAARRTLAYSDVPEDESSQPRLKCASDIHNRVTPRDRPRITPVSQPIPTFAYRTTDPEIDQVSEQDEDRDASDPGSDQPPPSAHLKAAASKRPLDQKPLVSNTHYSFVAKKSRDDPERK
jgi:hypothetical protein